MPTFTVEVTLEQQAFIENQIEIGLSSSANEVLVSGLKLLETQNNDSELKLARLRADIQLGDKAYAEGRYKIFEDELELMEYFVSKTKGRHDLELVST